MSDFTPVTLVKNGHEYVAHTPAELVNAQFGLGYAIASPAPAPAGDAAEPVADAAEKAPAPTSKRSTGRAASEGASA